jgi:hypothetical protein
MYSFRSTECPFRLRVLRRVWRLSNRPAMYYTCENKSKTVAILSGGSTVHPCTPRTICLLAPRQLASQCMYVYSMCCPRQVTGVSYSGAFARSSVCEQGTADNLFLVASSVQFSGKFRPFASMSDANEDFIPNLPSLPSAEGEVQDTPRNSVVDTRLPRAVQRKVVPSEESGGTLRKSAKMQTIAM